MVQAVIIQQEAVTCWGSWIHMLLFDQAVYMHLRPSDVSKSEMEGHKYKDSVL